MVIGGWERQGLVRLLALGSEAHLTPRLTLVFFPG